MPIPHATYLPQANSASPWQITPLGAGYANVAPRQAYPPPEHPADHLFEWERGRTLAEYQILFISKGSGTLETETTAPTLLEAPFLILLFPGVWHRYRPDPETGWEEHWTAFDGPYARSLQAHGVIDPQTPTFQVGHAESLLTQFQILYHEIQSESLGFRSVLASCVIQILAFATCLPHRQIEESQAIRSVIRKASYLIREKTDEAISPEIIAAQLNIGYTYFRRMFKRYTGLSPKRYHTQLRLERAKRLLRETDLSVSEIAARLNFDTPFHLSSWFKKLTGLSPRTWRLRTISS